LRRSSYGCFVASIHQATRQNSWMNSLRPPIQHGRMKPTLMSMWN
jgi:hypothetical protein